MESGWKKKATPQFEDRQPTRISFLVFFPSPDLLFNCFRNAIDVFVKD